MSAGAGPVLVLSTVGTREDAERIADALVGERLAACVNVVPGLRSTYRWKGAVEREDEVLLLIKTRAERVEEMGARLRALHPYELPEMIVLPIAGGHGPYLDWIADGVR
ncbi:MAG: divalent-cation tolerance protein CutA [Acidobacteria bacterium]|nr:MAG: divalent-cation tolerance protein CutA [Acidobacteriota bacterium]